MTNIRGAIKDREKFEKLKKESKNCRDIYELSFQTGYSLLEIDKMLEYTFSRESSEIYRNLRAKKK